METSETIQQSKASEIRHIAQTIQNSNNHFIDEGNNDGNELLQHEGGENFYNYVEWLRLVKKSETIILPSQNHYFFDNDEVKNVKAIINLKLLNQIRNIGSLIDTVFRLLKPSSYFIGKYAIYGTKNKPRDQKDYGVKGRTTKEEAIENDIISGVPVVNRIYNFFDSRTSRNITNVDLNKLFTSRGFKIIDITEIDGQVFFCAEKVKDEVN